MRAPCGWGLALPALSLLLLAVAATPASAQFECGAGLDQAERDLAGSRYLEAALGVFDCLQTQPTAAERVRANRIRARTYVRWVGATQCSVSVEDELLAAVDPCLARLDNEAARARAFASLVETCIGICFECEAEFRRAQDHRANRQWQQALDALAACLGSNRPGDRRTLATRVRALGLRARIFMDTGQSQRARQAIDEMLRLNPGYLVPEAEAGSRFAERVEEVREGMALPAFPSTDADVMELVRDCLDRQCVGPGCIDPSQPDDDGDGTIDVCDACPDDARKWDDEGECGCGADLDETDDDGDGFSECGGDCDDTDRNNYPGNTEVCDAADNNCDSNVDEGLSTDVDGDGFYAPGSCMTPATDCNDDDADIHPGRTEVCDAVDNNCDSSVDEGFDVDGDGVTTCGGDCADDDADRYPGRAEACDGVDNDCDLSVDEDFDVDGDGVTTCGGDCADDDADRYPGNPEACDGVDNNCDDIVPAREIDDDGDGVPSCMERCPNDAGKTEPGVCGCGRADTDLDSDGRPDCLDPCPVDALDDCRRWSLGVQAGFFIPDSELSNKPQEVRQAEAIHGVRVERRFGRRWAGSLDATITAINSDTRRGDVEALVTRVAAERWLGKPGARPWFLVGGGGRMDFRFEPDSRVTGRARNVKGAEVEFVSIGAGGRHAIDQRARFRWELRLDYAPGDNDFPRILNVQALIGVTWAIGPAN